MKNKFLSFLILVILPIAVVVIIYFGISKNSGQTSIQATSNSASSSSAASQKIYAATSQSRVTTAAAVPTRSTRAS